MPTIRFTANFEGEELSVDMDSDIVNNDAARYEMKLSDACLEKGGQFTEDDLFCLENAASIELYFYRFFGPEAKTEDIDVELTDKRAEVLPRRRH